MSDLELEPASFRDPASTVAYLDGRVLRGLTKEGAADFDTLAAAPFFDKAMDDGKLVRTTQVPVEDLPQSVRGDAWVRALEHERIPFVSYPYEWTFSMLKDAALVHLDLLLAALDADLTMKDGYAYNLAFTGARPVFIDIGSFERVRPGEPWAGYRQFCQTMLYPLLLQAHKDVRFQPWLRGAVQGIQPQDLAKLFTGTDKMKPGVLKHVVAPRRHGPALLQVQGPGHPEGAEGGRVLDRAPEGHRHGHPQAGGPPRLGPVGLGVERLPEDQHLHRHRAGDQGRLRRQVPGGQGGQAGLRPGRQRRDLLAGGRRPRRLRGLRRRRRPGPRRPLPVAAPGGQPPDPARLPRPVRPLARASAGGAASAPASSTAPAPTPSSPWPCSTTWPSPATCPLAELVDWLHSLGGRLVVEFVDPTDPMADRLLANKPPGMHGDYRREVFERLLEARFDIVDRAEFPSGTRTLYHATPRR